MSEELQQSQEDDPSAEELAEAEHLGIPAEHYEGLSKRERKAMKSRRTATLKAEARRNGIDPAEYLALDPEDRARARIQAKAEAQQPPPDADDEPEAPPTEFDPARREGMTVGPIVLREKRPDFIGKAAPRTLRDLYTYFTIGDGQHVIRVERKEPKVFQGIACAGYLGEIRERVSESQFQRYFGGRFYEAQVYGPDPKGAHDELTGLPKVKALTEPITITVPLLPPNLHVLPAARPESDEGAMQGIQGFNPFATAPATPADAKMHETNMNFVWKQIESAKEERDKAVREISQVNGGTQDRLIRIMEKQHDDRVAALKEEQAARDKVYEDRIQEEREARKKTDAELKELREKLNERKGGSGEAVEMVKALSPQRNASEEVARVSETFTEQIKRMKETHTEQLADLKERQQEELKRLEARHQEELGRERDRSRDLEQHYKKTLDEERSKRVERERELKDEVDRVRNDERSVSDRRVQETEKRYDDRIKDLDRTHDRELKSEAARWETKLTTTEATLKMELASVRERLAETKEELEAAQEEARKAGDPIEVINRFNKQAEAAGFEKPENKKGAIEVFAEAAGQGFGQMLSTFDKWWPQTMEKWNQRPIVQGQPRQLATQQMDSVTAARQRRVAWATEGSVPAQQQQPPNVPATPLGFQQQPDQQPPAQPVQSQAEPQPQPANGAAQAPPPQQPAQAAPGQPQTNPLNQLFSDQAIEGFRQNVEQAINAGVPAEAFAQQFAAHYKDPSRRLIELYKVEHFVNYVKARADLATSPILRRDGKSWMEGMWNKLQQIHAA